MDLTIKEAARLLGTSEQTMYRWIRSGTIKSYKVGETHRLNRVELLEFATERNMKVSPQFFAPEEQQQTPAASLLAGALARGGVLADVAAGDRTSALRGVCDRLPLPRGVDRDELYAILMAREALGSTAIGNGIAIPHPRSPLILGVKEPHVTLAFLQQPIDFAALDGKPVHTLFTIISPTIRAHLQLLSHLMFALQQTTVSALLSRRPPPPADEIIAAVRDVEAGLAQRAT